MSFKKPSSRLTLDFPRWPDTAVAAAAASVAVAGVDEVVAVVVAEVDSVSNLEFPL